MKIITGVSYLILIVKLILIESFAVDNIQDSILIKDCIITPQIWSLEAPTKFATTSELRKQTGSSVFAQGQSIIISGTILDQNCVPITGANVKIWQKNLGKPSSRTDKTKYTGSNISDNLGHFSFHTIMPAPEPNESPRVYFHISHPDIINFETIMLFPKNQNNDAELKNLTAQEKNLLIAKCKNCPNNEGAPIYEFKIIIEGKTNYKNY
ncbi:MAG: Protocatechuate 3,4-dioxygenase beta subunit [Candidatus Midichloria mitochondrii]|uniref:Intradiol ring-cleavage dioxygenase n=1 Tax=Midichloria mitochondrii (strain IricVA) TaxID=696127 RepID=F7XW27_MIDMI|nr:intradiol ring-cleavage dioxygenase [Candidatus Midichloria mitochondrii IricVA]MDJ1256549.1 hypothetical protein [Candidatus Midichloria mitochondrii]MDJ1299150.1 hypothetical protein [Candidatus Midichloria mitochondrii]MDJ1313285.1 hypothetical protein [Candidatus Midichloria mitochondrii]MDJ1583846.1 hypothetical protein [Candidatus Midichloria mitochondrii]